MGLNTLKAKNSLYISKEIRNEFLAFNVFMTQYIITSNFFNPYDSIYLLFCAL